MKKFALILAFVSSLSFLAACSSTANNRDLLTTPLTKDVSTMGTFIQITVYDKNKENAVKEALKIPVQYNTWTTVNSNGSQVDQINQNAGIKPVQVDKGVYQLIKDGLAYSEQYPESGYDITVGRLSKLWDIGFPDEKKPTQAEIDQVLPTINYKYAQMDDATHSVYLTHKGTKLDLGSIVKGYVAMLMVDDLKKAGVTTGIVNLGSSSIYVIGNSPRSSNSAWRIGIKNPNDPTGAQMGVLQAANQHVNTSGIYERYLTVDGVKYSHELNPKTGYPFNNDIASITLLISGEDPTNGDGLSTVLFSMGTKKAYEMVEKMKNTDVVIVDKDNKVYLTSGVKNKFELTSSDFKIGNINDLK